MRIGASRADSHSNHIINNTKTNNQRVTRNHYPINSDAKIYEKFFSAKFCNIFLHFFFEKSSKSLIYNVLYALQNVIFPGKSIEKRPLTYTKTIK